MIWCVKSKVQKFIVYFCSMLKLHLPCNFETFNVCVHMYVHVCNKLRKLHIEGSTNKISLVQQDLDGYQLHHAARHVQRRVILWIVQAHHRVGITSCYGDAVMHSTERHKQHRSSWWRR